MQKTSFNIFCLNTKKLRWRTLRCFRKIRESKNFMHKKGISLFSVEIFLSQDRKISYGNPSVFQKISGSGKKVMDKRGGGGGGVTRFFVEIFCLTVLKKFLGSPSVFQRISNIEKFLNKGNVLRFFWENFLSHFTEKLRRGPFSD